MQQSTYAASATGLRKRYGEKYALDGLDLTVPRGMVFGLLGPNGAGKTTAVRSLATLQAFDEGRAEVAGFDVRRQAAHVRKRIGLAGQYAAVDEVLTGRENLVMWGRLHHLGRKESLRRADELLEQFDLVDAGSVRVKGYSGGMRRRLDLAASLVYSPDVLFLDEPTTGLDPRSRNQVWQSVRNLVRDGTTVLLTTQYLDEADQLASEIAVIDRGRVIANGTPKQLKSASGGDQLEIVIHDTGRLDEAAGVLNRITDREVAVDHDLRQLRSAVADRVAALTETLQAFQHANIEVEDVAIRRPTLDDVFLQLTGHQTEEAA